MITKEKTSDHTFKKTHYLFHPFEIAFCGYSNSGKTTLISKLIESLKSEFTIGYIKHDVHKFQMDKEGKDTFKAWESGASQVLISDPRHTATIHKDPPDSLETKFSFLNYDFTFLEGYKNSSIPKIIFIDKDKKIFDAIQNGEIDQVIAFIGQDSHVENIPLEAPYFQRDDIVGLTQWIQNLLRNKSKQIPLMGLVLAGGHSTRMKQDKALLKYFEKTQAEIGYELLQPFCDSVFISSRENQWQNKNLNHLPQIHDRFLGFGPLGGILSAMQSNPQAAWLVIACDLPFLNKQTIDFLIKNRNPFKMATCFQSTKCDFPEPLCAIYEPKMFLKFLQFLAIGHTCPRKALINSPVQLLKQIDQRALENINFSEEYNHAKAQITQETHR